MLLGALLRWGPRLRAINLESDALQALRRASLVASDGLPDSAPCEFCADSHDAPIRHGALGAEMRCRHAGWTQIDPGRYELVRLKQHALITMIADALCVSCRLRAVGSTGTATLIGVRKFEPSFAANVVMLPRLLDGDDAAAARDAIGRLVRRDVNLLICGAVDRRLVELLPRSVAVAIDEVVEISDDGSVNVETGLVVALLTSATGEPASSRRGPPSSFDALVRKVVDDLVEIGALERNHRPAPKMVLDRWSIVNGAARKPSRGHLRTLLRDMFSPNAER